MPTQAQATQNRSSKQKQKKTPKHLLVRQDADVRLSCNIDVLFFDLMRETSMPTQARATQNRSSSTKKNAPNINELRQDAGVLTPSCNNIGLLRPLLRETSSGGRCCSNRASYSDGGSGAADATAASPSKAGRGVGSPGRDIHLVN